MEIDISRTDLEILTILWETGKPLTRAEITQRSEFSKYNSVGIRLAHMLESGVLQVADYVKTRTNIARSYVPAFTYEEYAAAVITQPKKTPSLKLGGLLSALIDTVDISEETIAELEAIIQRLKEKAEE
ncbi:BlaI/MecI/CopY family transcriptional regulator [Oscillospiraceae bacterium OttesenSCG-928-F05]|nr:BlaI/MecI/CopY family transcriptional regulator [Oscillospiraceae bacterium OttesenSCG-928-F05]